MNMKYIGGAGIVLALVLGLIGVFRPPKEIQVPTTQPPQQEKKVGALTGPEVPYGYLTVGGIERVYQKGNFRTASTTVCNIVSPAATSTWTQSVLEINTVTSSIGRFSFGSSTASISATTSIIADNFVLASGGRGIFTVQASTTQNQVKNVAPPNSNFNWTVTGADVGGVSYGYTFGGNCHQIFDLVR